MTHDASRAIRHRVLIAGGGVAGLEAMIALRAFAGDRVDVTLIAPTDEFSVRALSVQEPFALPRPRSYPLEDACAEHGARFVRDTVSAVLSEKRRVATQGSKELEYDSLLVAVGAFPVPVVKKARTFRGLQDAEAVHGLVQDLEGGYVKSIAFVVPPGVTWPLPLYELAFMTAERSYDLCIDVALSIVTSEISPLSIFGRSASEAVARELARCAISVHTDASFAEVGHGSVIAVPGDREVPAESVVALPVLTGPRIRGLPADPAGFLPVDDHGRVEGIEGVFAAGDGTTLPIKQGGLAAQQADAAARSIARQTGADVAEIPFRPQLQAKLLRGSQATYLRHAVTGGAEEGASEASSEALWWPPGKVAAPFLAPYLERVGNEMR